MFRTSLLLIAFSFISHECAVLADGSDTGSGGGLRDWMRNMKDRMLNRESGRLMSSLDLSKMKLPSSMISRMIGERMFQPVNLANVNFDPSMDRAYRMGNWYVIRRRSTNKDESVDDWSEFFDRKDDRWEVVNNGAQRVEDGSSKCILWEPTKSTSKKASGEVEELSAEVLNSAL